MKKIKLLTGIIAGLMFLIYSASALAQTLEDITGSAFQFGFTAPGIACKTRTNDANSVRNLALGVWNRDSDELVALNCGWTSPYAFSAPGAFNNNARIDGNIIATFVRTAGTPASSANETFCSISTTDVFSTDPNPNGADSVLLGTVTASFDGVDGDAEVNFPFFNTAGIYYPAALSGVIQFSAFCRLARGVRIQNFIMTGGSVNDGSAPEI